MEHLAAPWWRSAPRRGQARAVLVADASWDSCLWRRGAWRGCPRGSFYPRTCPGSCLGAPDVQTDRPAQSDPHSVPRISSPDRDGAVLMGK